LHIYCSESRIPSQRYGPTMGSISPCLEAVVRGVDHFENDRERDGGDPEQDEPLMLNRTSIRAWR
jgi:hypothetical protein